MMDPSATAPQTLVSGEGALYSRNETRLVRIRRGYGRRVEKREGVEGVYVSSLFSHP